MKFLENESQNEKFLLNQKIEMLNMELKESKQREENLKKMNENIMLAFDDVSKENCQSKIVIIFIYY